MTVSQATSAFPEDFPTDPARSRESPGGTPGGTQHEADPVTPAPTPRRHGLRWGILATGFIAGQFTADALIAGLDVRAVGSRSEESAQRFADTYGIPHAHGSYEALVADPEVDIIYVATPHPMHRETAGMALEAGKHVLVEKPFALNAREAEQIAAAARRSGVLVQEAFVWRHHPAYAAIKRLADAGAVGEWLHFRGHFSFVAGADSTRWNKAWGGGALYDVGCYPVSWARFFAGGEPIAADGYAVIDPDHGVDRRFVGALYFADGRTAHIEAAMDMPHGSFFELLGTKGRLSADFTVTAQELTIRCRIGTEEQSWTTDRITPFRVQAERFAEAVFGQSVEHPGADDAVSQSLAMDALFAAARTGRRCPVG